MWPSLIGAEPRTQQPGLMYDLCQDRQVVRLDQDVSRVLEDRQQLQGSVQTAPHPIGRIRGPGAAHRLATGRSGTRECTSGRCQVDVTWPDDPAGERHGRRRLIFVWVVTVPADDEGRSPCP